MKKKSDWDTIDAAAHLKGYLAVGMRRHTSREDIGEARAMLPHALQLLGLALAAMHASHSRPAHQLLPGPNAAERDKHIFGLFFRIDGYCLLRLLCGNSEGYGCSRSRAVAPPAPFSPAFIPPLEAVYTLWNSCSAARTTATQCFHCSYCLNLPPVAPTNVVHEHIVSTSKGPKMECRSLKRSVLSGITAALHNGHSICEAWTDELESAFSVT
jgi:hypothetical protein